MVMVVCVKTCMARLVGRWERTVYQEGYHLSVRSCSHINGPLWHEVLHLCGHHHRSLVTTTTRVDGKRLKVLRSGSTIEWKNMFGSQKSHIFFLFFFYLFGNFLLKILEVTFSNIFNLRN